MAHDLLAIADLVADAFNLAPFEGKEVLDQTPFLNLLPMEESSDGVTHRYAVEYNAPVVGFRDVNAGRDLDHSVDQIRTTSLKYLDFSWVSDVAAADAWRRGREDYIAREGLRHLNAALKKFEMQVLNGTVDGDSDGFDGLADASTVDALADAMVKDAGGTTADTASSVYAVNVSMRGVTGVYKGQGGAVQLGDTVVIERVVNPGSDNKTFAAYYTPAGIWLSLQVGTAYDIGRIVNLTEDSGKGLNDDLLSDLLSKFPVGYGPTHFVMSRRSRKQLQQSRTATNATGVPAPFPMESFGTPIVVTDSMLDTEALIT